MKVDKKGRLLFPPIPAGFCNLCTKGCETEMDAASFILFFTASWVLIITPGPDMIYVMTRGISQGPRAGVVSALGVTLGILAHTISSGEFQKKSRH